MAFLLATGQDTDSSVMSVFFRSLLPGGPMSIRSAPGIFGAALAEVKWTQLSAIFIYRGMLATTACHSWLLGNSTGLVLFASQLPSAIVSLCHRYYEWLEFDPSNFTEKERGRECSWARKLLLFGQYTDANVYL